MQCQHGVPTKGEELEELENFLLFAAVRAADQKKKTDAAASNLKT